MKKQLISASVASVSLLFGASLGVFSSAQISNQSQSAPPETTDAQYSSTEYDIQLSPLPRAVVPATVASSDLAETVDLENARLLHESGATSMYAAMSKRGMICLVVQIDHGADWVASSTCAPPDIFAKTGIGVRTNGEFGNAEGYLLPDTLKSELSIGVGGYGAGTESSNLIWVDPNLSNGERSQLPRANPDVQFLPEIEHE